jgi:hypothetical protein
VAAWKAGHKRECAEGRGRGAIDTTGGMPAAKRREYLRKNYGFICDCELCRRESEA